VVPFAVFMALLAVVPSLGLPARLEAALRVGIPALVVLLVARPVLDFRTVRPGLSTLVGIGVFVLWVGPDLLAPAWREGWLFQNSVVGRVESSVPPDARGDPVVLALRVARAALIVPVVEELFWRGWLPRWLDRMDDFRAVPLGAFTRWSFWGSAALFALEHGSFWDVGLAAGIAYNWWMIRTRSLGDLILCHAVTNACLAGFVLAGGRWEYW
jgi:uncharacterized protein